jgi:tetratricopeptide (TPR) repeat protein
MKRVTALFLAAVLLLSLAACGGKDPWQEQYDLGMRYLNEGNYQEAIIAFEAAIEIDAKRPEAYLGAAEAYIAADDIDAAIAILEKGYAATNDETLKNRLGEIKSGTFNDYWGRAKRQSGYDESGALVWYSLYTYDAQGRTASVTSYDAAGNQTSHVDCVYDKNGKELVSYYSDPGTGMFVKVEKTYDTSGLVTKETETYSNGSVDFTAYQYDENCNCIREDVYAVYEGEGELLYYALNEYNAAGLVSKRTNYDPNGKMTSYYISSYNDAGDLTEVCGYSGGGQLQSRSVYHYDIDGNHIGAEYYDGDGNLLHSTSYQD